MTGGYERYAAKETASVDRKAVCGEIYWPSWVQGRAVMELHSKDR